MRVAVVSFKECWRDPAGRWYSSGGFPLQVGAVGSLFDELELLVVEVPARPGGVPLPARARVTPMRRPVGQDLRRKLSLAARAPYYLWHIGAQVARADVVHVPLPGDLPLLALGMAVLLRRRVVARYGGSWADNAETTSFERLTKSLMRRLGGGRHVMLATGHGAAEPGPGMHWIFSTALARAELEALRVDLTRPPSDPPRAVFIGRLEREKGIDVLLRALARLRDTGGAVLQVTLAGDGGERESLARLARELGLDGQVTFAGQLDRAALSAAVSGADWCVQPSRTEGFSKAWLDALAHGLPVLASDVGAARAVIGEDGERGWLVRPGDEGALVDALRRVTAEPRDWPAVRRRCRAYAEAHTLEAWAAEIGRRCAAQWGERGGVTIPAT